MRRGWAGQSVGLSTTCLLIWCCLVASYAHSARLPSAQTHSSGSMLKLQAGGVADQSRQRLLASSVLSPLSQRRPLPGMISNPQLRARRQLPPEKDPFVATVFANSSSSVLPRLGQPSSISTPVASGSQAAASSKGHADKVSASGSVLRISIKPGSSGAGNQDSGSNNAQTQQVDSHSTSTFSKLRSENKELDLEKAKLFGHFTAIAYCSQPDLLAAWNCTRCTGIPEFQPARVVRDTPWNLLAYVGYHPPMDAIVVAFRGTDSSSWGNWAENLRTWRTDHMYPVPEAPHALIHAGFYSLWAASMLKPQITDAVATLMQQHPTAQIYATGHSMGAAVAQLCALDLKFAYNRTKVGSYTFGAPRVGNAAYADLFDFFVPESWRFTHNRDIVPSVPLQYMGFHHVAQEVWVVDVESSQGAEMKILMCDETGEDPSCHNSACYLGLCTSIVDHLVYLGIHMYQDGVMC